MPTRGGHNLGMKQGSHNEITVLINISLKTELSALRMEFHGSNRILDFYHCNQIPEKVSLEMETIIWLMVQRFHGFSS